MTDKEFPVAIVAAQAPPRARITTYPDHLVVFLEMGDRTPGDEASYPDDDLRAEFVNGAWRFTRKDGSPF